MKLAEKLAATDPWSALPRELVPIMRRDAHDLAVDIVREVRDQIPEYHLTLSGPTAEMMVAGIETAVQQFADRVANPRAPRGHCPDTYRTIGQCELAAGRGLDALHSAYRLAARVIWRRIVRLGERVSLSVQTVGLLGEAMFAHIDELAALSAEGYATAQAREAGVLERRRRRLLELLLADPPTPRKVILDLARASRWEPPELVRAVAIDLPDEQPGATGPQLPDTVLVDLEGSQPCLLATSGDLREPAVRHALRDWRAVTGPAVPLAEAARSMRWARQALALVRRGVLPDARPTDCAAHLSTLLLLTDEPLVAELADRVLAPLAKLTERQRDRLAETLLAWLVTRGGAPEMAARLGIHPQTVRYRMHQLEDLFGERLRDPDLRFDLEVALRALRLRREATLID